MRITKILKPTKKKIIILVVLIIITLLGFNLAGQRKQTPPQLTQVKRQDIRSVISASGTLTGKNTANLKFKSSGKLAYINIKPGDYVYTGQIIAGLDTQDLSVALQQAQNTYKDKQAAADKILDDIHLFQYGNGGFGNVGTINETMAQRQLRTAAEVARDNAFDNVKLAQKAFQDNIFISPINGVVTQAVQVTGQTVGGADLIAQVVDTTGIYFDTDVDEADIEKVTPDLPAEVTLDAYPNSIFKGVVDQILPQTKSTSSGATVITVRIKLDNPKLNFVNGFTGQASIITEEAKNVLVIPQEALREDNSIVSQSDKGFKSQKVTTGIRSDTDVEIKEGLQENENILLNPPAEGLGLNLNRNRNPLGGLLRSFGGGRR